MAEGLLNKDFVYVEKDKKTLPDIKVRIKSADGYEWKARGQAGMAAIAIGTTTEVDFIGTGEDIMRLLTTAMIKVGQLASKTLVERAIEEYRKT